jgi:hypothetical protein
MVVNVNAIAIAHRKLSSRLELSLIAFKEALRVRELLAYRSRQR